MAGGLKAYIKLGKLGGESAKDGRSKDGFHDLLAVSLGGSCNWDFSQEVQPTRTGDFFYIRMKDEVRITSDSLSFSGSEMLESISFTSKTLELEHKAKNKKDD